MAITIAFFFLLVITPSNAEHVMTFEFSFNYPSIIHDENGYLIEMNGCDIESVNGMLLPSKHLSILLPPYKTLSSISVHGIKKYVGRFHPASSPPLVVSDVISKEKPDYGASTKPYEIVGVYELRGYRILVMNLHPVVYERGRVYYYANMEVKVKLKNADMPSLYRAFDKDRIWVKKHVINSWIADEYPVKNAAGKYDYLIITTRNFSKPFQKLADYRNSTGMRTTVCFVEDIISNPAYWNETAMFNDTQAKIRNFIRWAYKNWGIDYVLLGGDADIMNADENIIPARYLYAACYGLPLGSMDKLEAYIPSDVYYACLDGNFNKDMDDRWGENATDNDAGTGDEADLYAEVWVGRACVDSVEEAYNVVNKTIVYENEDVNDSHIMQVLMLGEYLGFGGEAEWGGNYKDKVVLYVPEAYNITKMYDKIREWSKSELINKMNEGVHIINHDGHGWTTYGLKMSNSDVSRLYNTKYFFVYSQTCLAGSFDNWYPGDHYYKDDCFAETITTSKYGAFAVIMNSRYGLGRENSTDSPGERYDISFFKTLFDDSILELGRANHLSKEENVWRIDENGMRWTYYETNLFGDPAVRIKEPGEVVKINISVNKPGKGIYIFNFGPFLSSINRTFIIGSITIEANITTEPSNMISKINFMVDGEVMASYSTPPYTWTWRGGERGEHYISIVAYAKNGKSERVDIQVTKLL